MQRSLPIIGITTYGRDEKENFYLPSQYVDGVRHANGLPVMLAPGEKKCDEVFDLVDGILFAGGGDFAPEVYGGAPHPTISRIDPERDSFEVALARRALQGKKPVFGICRGFQLLNIVTGGDLLAHLPEKYGNEISHRRDDGDETPHEVKLVASSRLAEITGSTSVSVMSKHHQALGKIGDGWQVVAKAADGVVEALEAPHHPWMVAVHWHPELALDDPRQQRLFDAFVAASSG